MTHLTVDLAVELDRIRDGLRDVRDTLDQVAAAVEGVARLLSDDGRGAPGTPPEPLH